MLYYVKSLTLLKFEYKVEIYLNMKLFCSAGHTIKVTR